MAIPITMPRMSDTMEEGTLVKWNVKEGDKVKAGDEVAEIETDKATMPMPVYDDGVIAKLVAQPGATLKVGQLLLMLAVGNESVEDAAKAADGAGGGEAKGAAPAQAKKEPAPAAAKEAQEKKQAAPAESDEGEESVPASPSAPGSGGARVRVSPLARKLAEEAGVDIARVKGTGPDGRIIKRDIEAAKGSAKPQASAGANAPTAVVKSQAPAPALESKTVPVSNMRKVIARRLLESKTTIPHFTVTVTADMDALLALRVTLNDQLASQKVKLSVNDFIVKACAAALLQHPLVNASWTDEGIRQYGTVNVGVAVALPQDKGGGLVVPVIRDAQNKGLRTISVETKQLADKARSTGLSMQEMADGTFTISNLGMLGVDHFEAIINPPQAAILAVGAAVKKPVVRASASGGDQIVVGNEMTLTLSADHRVVDGAMAAEYLGTVKKLLENPAVLLV